LFLLVSVSSDLGGGSVSIKSAAVNGCYTASIGEPEDEQKLDE